MKKLLISLALVSFLFILSSCYSYNQVSDILDEKEEQWLEEYNTLEDKYFEAIDRVERLESALISIGEEYFPTLYCYYDGMPEGITKEEAHDALLRIHDILTDLGY